MTRIVKQEDIKLRTGILEYQNSFNSITYNDTRFLKKEMRIIYARKYEELEICIINMEWGNGYEYFKLTDEEVMEHIIKEAI